MVELQLPKLVARVRFPSLALLELASRLNQAGVEANHLCGQS